MKPEYCNNCRGFYEPEGTQYEYLYSGQFYEDKRCKHREVCALAFNIASIVIAEELKKMKGKE